MKQVKFIIFYGCGIGSFTLSWNVRNILDKFPRISSTYIYATFVFRTQYI